MAWTSPNAWSSTASGGIAPGGGPVSGIEPWLGGPGGGGGGGAPPPPGTYNWGDIVSGRWFDPTNNYGGAGPTPNGPMDQVPTLSDYLQRQNWQIAYDTATQGAGLTSKGAFANYVRSQQDLMQRAYNAALVRNNNLLPQEFLAGFGGPGGLTSQMQQSFNALPYQLRGEDPKSWGQGPLGWVVRN